MSIACLFPGQGSQSKGMGAELFDRYPDWTTIADDVLGYSIRELCLDDPRGELGQTAFTQPALFVVNAMSYRARTDEGLAPPAFVAGHSLGEYNALVAAGVFDFANGLRMVRERGALMGQISGGGMMAVIGLPPARIEAVLGASDGRDAGWTWPISTRRNRRSSRARVEDLAATEAALKAAGARACIVLKVSAAFHSRYMHEPMRRFKTFLANFDVRTAVDSRRRQSHRTSIRAGRPSRDARRIRSDIPSAGWTPCAFLPARASPTSRRSAPARCSRSSWRKSGRARATECRNALRARVAFSHSRRLPALTTASMRSIVCWHRACFTKGRRGGVCSTPLFSREIQDGHHPDVTVRISSPGAAVPSRTAFWSRADRSAGAAAREGAAVTRLLSCVSASSCLSARRPAAILATAPLDVLFWLFIACVGYAYVGYPLLLVAASLVVPARKSPLLSQSPGHLPRVSVVGVPPPSAANPPA